MPGESNLTSSCNSEEQQNESNQILLSPSLDDMSPDVDDMSTNDGSEVAGLCIGSGRLHALPFDTSFFKKCGNKST